GRRDHHHRDRQPHERPRAALHAVRGRRGELHRRLDPPHVRPSVERVEGRRDAVHALLDLARGGRERGRVPRQGHPGGGDRPARLALLRHQGGREAHGDGAAGRRGRSVPEVRDREGQPHPAQRRWGRRLRRRWRRWPAGRWRLRRGQRRRRRRP
ncbi:MAG: Single-stranded DNA-binding protein, partial [uncultured Quadrisphaera sp.]